MRYQYPVSTQPGVGYAVPTNQLPMGYSPSSQQYRHSYPQPQPQPQPTTSISTPQPPVAGVIGGRPSRPVLPDPVPSSQSVLPRPVPRSQSVLPEPVPSRLSGQYSYNLNNPANSGPYTSSSNGVSSSTPFNIMDVINNQSVLPGPVPSSQSVLPGPIPSSQSILYGPIPSSQSVLPRPIPSGQSILPRPVPSSQSVLPEPVPSRLPVQPLPPTAPPKAACEFYNVEFVGNGRVVKTC